MEIIHGFSKVEKPVMSVHIWLLYPLFAVTDNNLMTNMLKRENRQNNATMKKWTVTKIWLSFRRQS